MSSCGLSLRVPPLTGFSCQSEARKTRAIVRSKRHSVAVGQRTESRLRRSARADNRFSVSGTEIFAWSCLRIRRALGREDQPSGPPKQRLYHGSALPLECRASWSDRLSVPHKRGTPKPEQGKAWSGLRIHVQASAPDGLRSAQRSSSLKFRWLLRCSRRTSLARERAGAHRPEDYGTPRSRKNHRCGGDRREPHSPVNLTRGDWALDRRGRLVCTAAFVNILWPRQFRCHRGS